MQPIFANGTIKSDRTLHFHSFLECFSLVQQPSPCFARYFILAIAVNLVQDQIWSWSSRTFHVEFDRVNQSAWSLPLKFFNFKFKSSETKDGWHFLRFFNATTCIQSQKSTFNHLYTTNSTKITFSKTTFIKLLQYFRKRFLSYVYPSSIKIDIMDQWIERRSHTCNSKNFPFRTIDNATLHNYKEQRNGGW